MIIEAERYDFCSYGATFFLENSPVCVIKNWVLIQILKESDFQMIEEINQKTKAHLEEELFSLKIG